MTGRIFMATTLISVAFWWLLICSFGVLAPAGFWSNDSLAYNLFQLVSRRMTEWSGVVSTIGVTIFLAVVAYFAARGVQEIFSLWTFLLFNTIAIGSLSLGHLIAISVLRMLARV